MSRTAGIALTRLESQCLCKSLSIRLAWASDMSSKRQELEDVNSIKDYTRQGHRITVPYFINQSCYRAHPDLEGWRNRFPSLDWVRTTLQNTWDRRHCCSSRGKYALLQTSFLEMCAGLREGNKCSHAAWKAEPRVLWVHNLTGVLIKGVPFY